VDALLATGVQKVRVLVRDPIRAAKVVNREVEIVSGGRTDAHSLDRAMRNVEQVFIIPPNVRHQADLESRIYSAAHRLEVDHVVKLSTVKADPKSTCYFFKEQAMAEEHLKASSVKWTILRSNSYMQNLFWFAEEVKSKSTLSLPMGNAKTAPVDRLDLTAVAAVILSGKVRNSVTLTISGPERLSFNDIAERLSTAIGKKVKYRDVAPDDFLRSLFQSGRPGWYAKAVLAAWSIIRQGKPRVTNVVPEVARKNPLSFGQFAHDHARAFLN
jgi:uncharacterized protein YbjT (DUF2867 family)